MGDLLELKRKFDEGTLTRTELIGELRGFDYEGNGDRFGDGITEDSLLDATLMFPADVRAEAFNSKVNLSQRTLRDLLGRRLRVRGSAGEDPPDAPCERSERRALSGAATS